VGCSLGHVLRLLETEKLPAVTEVVGIDIDREAIRKGRRYLDKVGSNVHLICGDMEGLNRLLGDRRFDFIYAAGALSYLDMADATAVVREMLQRTNKILALAGLANRNFPNDELG